MTYSVVIDTLRVAAGATGVSLIAGIWLGHALKNKKAAGAVLSVLLILPPTIVASYFLFHRFAVGAAIAAGILSGLPFVARAARLEFQRLDRQTLNAARISGASEWRVFWRIALPLAGRPLAAAAAIVFARLGTECALTLWIAQP
ncbi:MAG TPA: ABC transporter permease subunit [Bryobacteraceae bacterium]|nr:ABC transporter permease subunit [Bryobacteraceae bacterium]